MIRMAKEADIPHILAIYDSARAFMHTHGNPTQWAGNYPALADIQKDLATNSLYVSCGEDGTVHGVFALVTTGDPNYAAIYDGAWLSDRPYAAIHRIASDGKERGLFRQAVAFVRKNHDHIRIDTHKDNLPMQNAILREGFSYRGIIHIADGSPRNAYEWER